ncbi:hypothetical protein TcasGA2_TC016234 [Tribolium castaneum]|uniref:Uncharacterized protein n=1 Tax=Tribolium castaneum TaxID=7070 RepID=D6X4S9_TRICA|nr:hypothetical protein TcasGA2_TC016234 [Tribolium castaneum]
MAFFSPLPAAMLPRFRQRGRHTLDDDQLAWTAVSLGKQPLILSLQGVYDWYYTLSMMVRTVGRCSNSAIGPS